MERSIDGVRDLPGAYFELGRLYLARYLEEQQEARKHISESGTRHDLLAAEERLDQAALAFEEAQQLGALLPWQRDYAAAARRLAQSDFASCAATCDRILAMEPDLEEVWRLRGDALRLAGEDPIESYERALAVRRSDYPTLFAMAEVYVERGDLARARELLERACTIWPGYADAWMLRARASGVEGRAADDEALLEDGVAVARRALELDAGHYATTVLLAEAQTELARRRADDAGFVEALATLDAARALRGCQNRVNLLRARALLERARAARAASEPGPVRASGPGAGGEPRDRAGDRAGDRSGPGAWRARLADARAMGREATAVHVDQPRWQALLREVERALGQP
jgi:tetratricopeptide (TPR) repeat protein